MSRFSARCLIVGAAVALVVAGVLAPVSGAGQVVLLGAGACCALVDVVLHRSALPHPGTRPVAVVAPRGPDQPWAPDPLGVPEQPTGSVADGGGETSVLVLGHGPGGRVLRVDAASHVVVAGAGALALAVFRGLAEQLRAATAQDHGDLRWAVAPGLLCAAGLVSDDQTPSTLPPGTAVAVRLATDGRPQGSVVLVAGLGSAPRHWDVTVEVSRYGCSVRRPDDHRAVRVSPALPLLAPEPASTE
ncbi:hypothetical protein DEJ17_00175 [Curtobacterium sp. MCSS17_011]|uniref:hypothetical protein n=1 Tax=Curtobacterium sp. MCSS17_011 TaxID=2175643 RepID=UPI000D9F14C3|nr:hypothetical protein [Curtobacterium sp. MCSS17_011]PYY62972.1 hypothetical protein DEJ17_00175 [Curtobacterium sp. MCSS17_011]